MINVSHDNVVAPLQKFTSFLEEIFEAEDSLPLDADDGRRLSPAITAHFSHLMTSFSAPLLHANSIRKLTSLLVQLSHPSKRSRMHPLSSHTDARGDSNRKNGTSRSQLEPIVRLSQVESTSLQRLLRMLGRSVELGSGERYELAPFDWRPPENGIVSTQKSPEKSPKKRKKESVAASKTGGKSVRSSRSRSRSHSRIREFDEEPGGDNSCVLGAKFSGVPDTLPIAEAAKFDRELGIATECALGVECCLALLSADALPKQAGSNYPLRPLMLTVHFSGLFRRADIGLHVGNQKFVDAVDLSIRGGHQ